VLNLCRIHKKWCTEFASYTRRFSIFLVQNSDNPT